jgi:MFS transporter, DHA1 family, inner membrane transport protein
MAYFRNTTVNLLNLHYAIHAIAISGGGAFFAAYLLRAGLPPYGVFASIAAILLGRFVIRPLVVGAAIRWGVRALVVAGTLLSALQYPVLAEVRGVGPALFLLCAMSSMGDTLYWSTYHAYFASLGDDEHRGHQLGAREATAAMAGIVSPLVAGWLLVTFGPRVAFGVTAFIVAASALPLLWTPDVRVARSAPGAYRAALPGILFFLADGWTGAGFYFVWQIALFISLGQNIIAFGGALAIAALVGAVGGMFLGRHIDGGNGKRAVWIAFGTFALVVLLRASTTHNAGLAVVANALGALSNCLYVPTLMTAVYTLAKRAPCTLRFHIATEGGWDVGGAGGLLAAALLSYLGVPLWVGIALSLLGLGGSFALLQRYYGGLLGPLTTEMAE